MGADSTLTTVIAVALVVGGMTAAVARHRGSPLRDSGRVGTSDRTGTPGEPGPVAMLSMLGMLGTGAIMLGALVAPGFSHFAAVSLTCVVLLLFLAGVVAVRIRRQRPLRYTQRTAVAVAVVDIAFMSAAVMLMPVHSAVAQIGTAQLASVAQLGGAHSAGSHLSVAGGLMTWLVLVAWAFCAAVLSVPAILRSSPDGAFQLVCSGCMIAAMAAMAI